MVVVTYWPHPRTVIEHQALPLLSTMGEKMILFEKTGVENVVIYPFTLAFAALSTEDFLQSLKKDLDVNTLVIGANHRMGKGGQSGTAQIEQMALPLGIQNEVVNLFNTSDGKISSSEIRKALQNGLIEKANRMLGYPYFISGTVVRGDQLGRKIGFPTANLQLKENEKLIPQYGAYAVRAVAGSQTFQGMMYIGERPILHSTIPSLRLEVHLFDFDGNLYGQEMSVSLHAKIRDDIHFPTWNDLQAQLRQDEIKARGLLSVK